MSQAQATHPGQGHRARLRERFLEHGLAKFTDEEALELLLTLATPRKDCKRQARGLMKRLGSLQAVLDAPPEALAQEDGIGPKNILGLKLVPAVARRYLEDRLKRGQALVNAQEAAAYLDIHMRPLTREVFQVILLDAHRRVMAVEELFAGTLNESPAYPREVVAKALAAGASAVVCAHNHPSGGPQPSQADRDFTRRLYHACAGVGLELMDHVIVSAEGLHSFAQAGDLRAWAQEHQTMNL